MKPENSYKDSELEEEALLFARYLLDCDPPREMVSRYIDTIRQLGVNTVTTSDEHILNFSVSHPWSIPFLDAATGILRPEAALRKKIYAMAAVLEASPRYSECFLPVNLSPLVLFSRLITNGFTAFLKVIIGIPMLMLIGKGKRAND